MRILVPTVSFFGIYVRFFAAWVHGAAKTRTHAVFVEEQLSFLNRVVPALRKGADDRMDSKSSNKFHAVIEDDKLQYIKQCDNSRKKFKPDRPDSRFCCTECHDAYDR